jgi:8-oxo-dGTP diphosphatase
MEPAELNDPLTACFREIEEETGINRANIINLELLYIIIRRRADRISQMYIYFGETAQTDIVQTDEGELFWIPEEELLDREYTNTFAAMLRHCTARAPDDRAVYIGAAENDGMNLRMVWAKCEDFENY